MSGITHATVSANGIDIHVAEAGRGRPVVFCHGFPELWYSWRRQLPALAAAGYHAIAPDMRGYGRTSAPAEPAAYDFATLTADMTGLLDALGEDRAVFVGHDWGAALVWHLARAAPDRVEAVANLSVPYISFRGRQPAAVRQIPSDRFVYFLYFQQAGVADEELNRDPRLTIARFFWSISGDAPGNALNREAKTFLDWLSDPPALPAWLTDADLDYYAAEFAHSGFTGGLNWYRNGLRNAEIENGLVQDKVTQPALFVAGDRDLVVRAAPLDAMDEWVPGLRRKVLLPGCGHWTQQERPDEVTHELLRFLADLPT